MMPALTKPRHMMAVAAELWIMPVTAVPKARPFNLLLVSFCSIRSRLAPAALLRPSPIMFIPYKKRPIPASVDKIVDKPISFPMNSIDIRNKRYYYTIVVPNTEERFSNFS